MLNPQQTAAVKYTEGPLLVLAGAGSGKTRVITQKIAYLIRECDLHANQILAVTFTNKAANEMRERVAGILSTPKRRGLKVSTFHTFGLSVIKKYAGACGLKKGFTIGTHNACLVLLKCACANLHIDTIFSTNSPSLQVGCPAPPHTEMS